jgi:translation initiation factor 1
MKSRPATGGLVYSTEGGRMCPACREPLTTCQCKALTARPVGQGAGPAVTVWRESKGRGGKAVTVVRGLALDPSALAALGKQLRTVCGAGGTVKGGAIEVQGEQAERILLALRALGFTAKRAGG